MATASIKREGESWHFGGLKEEKGELLRLKKKGGSKRKNSKKAFFSLGLNGKSKKGAKGLAFDKKERGAIIFLGYWLSKGVRREKDFRELERSLRQKRKRVGWVFKKGSEQKEVSLPRM